MTDLIKTYLQESLDNKKGITIYLQGGNTVAGGVTRIHEDYAVEMKNQRSPKILVLLDAVVAIEVS